MTQNYCIILAGGIGRRLWPVSSKTLPKQFLDFFGTGRTLLQQTYDRFAAILPPNRIFVSTFEDYVPLVRRQLPEIPQENILPEPVQLNTAPAAIWGTWHAVLADREATIIATPADQLIQYEDRFRKAMIRGLNYVREHPHFLAIGVKPTMPNTAYGYIQMGEPTGEEDLYRVQSFSEKPAPDYARMFLESGEFLWNTGIFLWKGETMGDKLAELANRPNQPVETIARQTVTIAEEMEYVRSVFTENVPSQIDLFILEKCSNVVVQACDFGWADIGCWNELRKVGRQDADGNVAGGKAKVIFQGTQNTIVHLPAGKKAVISGLDGFLVAEENNILMICPNESPESVSRLINEAQMELL